MRANLMHRREFLKSLLALPVAAKLLVTEPSPALCACGKPMPALARPFDFNEDYLQPAVKALAARIDADCLKAYEDHVGITAWRANRVPASLTFNGRVDGDLLITFGGQGYIARAPKIDPVLRVRIPGEWTYFKESRQPFSIQEMN